MLRKTLLMLATALGFSQVGESQQVKSGTAPPVTTSHLMDRLKERTTPVLRDDLIVHSRHDFRQ